jgi:hypothetical protein
MYPNNQSISESRLNLQRDLEERTQLAISAGGISDRGVRRIVTLTDGPLELFHDPQMDRTGQEKSKKSFFDSAVEIYQEQLEQLNSIHAAAAGYVDKPRSDLIVQLLELIPVAGSSGSGVPRHPGLIDASLFRSLLVHPGDRSAVFRIQSPSLADYTNENTLYFFYLNVGQEGTPAIARAEIPGWTAADPELLDLVHTVIMDQCCTLGSQSYPYLLHRAHEIAVISYEETDRLEEMIIDELLNHGAPIGDGSFKQALKNGRGRTRYGK